MASSLLDHANSFVWNYVFGPFLAFLPERWRSMWFGNRDIAWRGATIISGALQSLVTPIVLLLWSARETCRIGQVMGSGCGEGPMQMFYLLLTALNPVTWLLFYLVFEGPGRIFAAAMMGETNGTLPLVLLDWAYLFSRGKIWKTAPPLVPDQVTEEISNAGWRLRIESCRRKRDWYPGRLLFYKDHYYRIASVIRAGNPRPYVFLLESVAAGVKSRSVILYSLDKDAPQPALSPQVPL